MPVSSRDIVYNCFISINSFAASTWFFICVYFPEPNIPTYSSSVDIKHFACIVSCAFPISETFGNEDVIAIRVKRKDD